MVTMHHPSYGTTSSSRPKLRFTLCDVYKSVMRASILFAMFVCVTAGARVRHQRLLHKAVQTAPRAEDVRVDNAIHTGEIAAWSSGVAHPMMTNDTVGDASLSISVSAVANSSVKTQGLVVLEHTDERRRYPREGPAPPVDEDPLRGEQLPQSATPELPDLLDRVAEQEAHTADEPSEARRTSQASEINAIALSDAGAQEHARHS